MISAKSLLSAASLLAVTALGLGAGAAAADTPTLRPIRFSGFNDHFNLGQGVSGNVCVANRDFDDSLVGSGARVWAVTCRGWSGVQGRLYLFPGAAAGRSQAAWRAGVGAAATCDFGNPVTSSPLIGAVACTLKASRKAYLAMARTEGGRSLAAFGKAAIADSLAAGIGFMSGASPEPPDVPAKAALATITGGADLSEEAASGSLELRRDEGYRSSHDWLFASAEQAFSDVALSNAIGSAYDRAEALYNLALNVSNTALNVSDKTQFAKADAYFAQADAALPPSVGGDIVALGLNYKAIHARNQGRYDEAISLATKAMASRKGLTDKGASRDATGVIITEAGANDFVVRVTPAQREQLRDVQALEVIATSKQARSDKAGARAALNEALAILNTSLSGKLVLGAALPTLDTQVRADLLRLDLGTTEAPGALASFRTAVTEFGAKYPTALPRAGFLMELARAEAASANHDAAIENRALADYEAAMDIFREKRGSLEASADLAQPYFDILLRRIGDNPAGHLTEVAAFFRASQTLIAQSSAAAALRQAQRLSSDPKTAGIERSLEDTVRQVEAKRAEILRLQQTSGNTALIAADQAAYDQLRADRRVLEDELQQAKPSYQSGLREQVDLDALKAALRPGEVYVKTFLLADHGYGMMITASEVLPYRIDLSRDMGASKVKALRKPIDDLRPGDSPDNYDVGAAHELFEALFQPAKAKLLAANHIVYEPDANLIGAPIAALVVEDSQEVMRRNRDRAMASRPMEALSYSGVAWLGARVPSSISLSAAAFVQVRGLRPSQAQKAFYGFGAPVIRQDPRAYLVKALASMTSQTQCESERRELLKAKELKFSKFEVSSVAGSLGADWTVHQDFAGDFTDAKTVAMGKSGELGKYRVLYFSTHGILPADNDECFKSALMTSLGDAADSNGLLDLDKIPDLDLDSDMVVLSACDTGRGANGNHGEALGGLVATFVQAGARNLVVSNWPVDSKATSQLMTSMFGKGAKTQANALDLAEQDLMKSDWYSHPYYWAAFMVVGDGAKAMPGG